ncbi:MAG: FAD-dependent monooxygenase [Castellaniella sp.]|uniref:FAD-dependent monooxygenase n=1 Tax=Castellaniella sp. TaxID=1955812 RepID=UPI002A359F1A|nr:FAD-dependent monooxygenase [Castellaniella sp.]MDY0309698.1 FAD-dependent monooxygenase [Castellaniella sp.]
MANPTYDITILGSGPVGCALALSLADAAPDPARIALAGPAPTPRPSGQAIDPRALALNHGSRRFLETLGAWPTRAADILSVHVSQAGHLGRTLIDHRELNVPRLGCVVAYDDLLDTLYAAVRRSGVTILPERPQRPLAGSPVHLRLADGPCSTRLALLSDGARPQGLRREYGQHAVLATVRAAAPDPGLAFERFTRTGPLALLPHPAGADLYSLVWCVPPERAQALQDLSNTAFDAALQAAFGQRLGRLQRIGETHAFPLSLHAGPSVLGQGLVAVGNAAQTLHPVAGQGLNLGLRDAAQLAQVLRPWLAQPDTPVQSLLEHHARQRRADRALTLGITDMLPRVFATANPLLRHACGLGLAALDLLPALRKPLAHHLLQGQRL